MKKVLIVENDLIQAMGLSRSLENIGFEAAGIAGTGMQAIELAARTSPDLILMDIGLPGGMNGIEAAIRMKELCDVPVVFLTAQSGSKVIKHTQACKPYGFILRPFCDEVLETALITALHLFEMEQQAKHNATLLEAAEEKLLKEHEVNAIIAEVSKQMMAPGVSLEGIASIVLEGARQVCRSRHGYVTIIDRETGDNIGLTLTGMLAGECEVTGENRRIRFAKGTDGRYPALFGYSLNTGAAIYSNDPGSHPASTGVPDGHIQLQGFLSVPVLLGNELVGQIALANPSTPYSENDLQAIQRLADFYAIVLQRKRDEEELAESDRRVRNILKHIDVYVYSIDYENGKPKTLYHSPKCQDITGYASEDFEADPFLWLKIIHENDRPKVLEYIEAINSGEKLPPVEHRIIRKDGNLSWVMNTYTAELDAAGRILRIQGFIIDMNERILMEHELLEARNTADAANRAKSEFLASMSHELRTPLNSILGFSQILAMDDSGSLSKKQKLFVQDIKDSGEHLLAMIGDILDLAKIEAGKIEIQKQPFDLYGLLTMLFETMQVQASEKSIQLVLKIAPDLGALDAEEVRIRQVLYNLLSNAIKFTGNGKKVGLDARGEGNRVIIKVWDEGQGIAEEDKERIFNPFEQVRQMHAVNQGTGLGLSIMQRLVELHGGQVALQSTLGQGSTFIVYLPGRIEERRNDTELPSPKSGKVTKDYPCEVLVVEDNPINQRVIRAILNSMNCQTYIASSGEDALELAQSREFDLILMDINLPGIDGIETMKRIRHISAVKQPEKRRMTDSRITVIALTAHAMKSDRENFIAQGMDDVITKPIDIEHFKEVVAIHTHSGTLPSPAASQGSTMDPEDLDRGLMLCGGDKAFHSEMLGIFSETYTSFGANLAEALEVGNPREAHRLVHSLRGSAANLGFSKVEGAARRLESRFTSGMTISINDADVMKLVDSVQATIAGIVTCPS